MDFIRAQAEKASKAAKEAQDAASQAAQRMKTAAESAAANAAAAANNAAAAMPASPASFSIPTAFSTPGSARASRSEGEGGRAADDSSRLREQVRSLEARLQAAAHEQKRWTSQEDELKQALPYPTPPYPTLPYPRITRESESG